MGKMHSRAKGKSGSKKPLSASKPSWVKYTDNEVEKLVVKLAKEGQTSSAIGMHLRDQYGIPSVKLIANKKIHEIMREKKIATELPEDVLALIKKAAIVRKHMGKNKHDMTALRGLQLTESKVKRLAKYYKKINRIPVEWKYVVEEHKSAAQ